MILETLEGSDVVMVTKVFPDGVSYQVWRRDTLVWHSYPMFGADAAHHAGGPAFTAAARLQEAEAQRLAAQK